MARYPFLGGVGALPATTESPASELRGFAGCCTAMAAQPTRVFSGCLQRLSLALSRSNSAWADCRHAIWRDINGAFNILLKALTDTSTSDVRVSFQIVLHTENSGISQIFLG